MGSRNNRRRIKLIQPRLQLRMVGAFFGLSCLALLVQALTLSAQMVSLSRRLPSDGGHVTEALPGVMGYTLLVSFLLLLPALLLVGIHTTFRIAGPLHRLERHLAAVARGERPEPCRIRKNDELQEFCLLLNEALESARSQGATERDSRSLDHRQAG